MMVKAYVINGLGIGCHEEVAHAFEKGGAEAEIVHIKQLLSGDKKLAQAQIVNFSGGFLHGDMRRAGMYAANEMEQAVILTEDEEKRFKDLLIEFSEKGNLVYGQCNGFQLLVRTGLLPGIGGDYSKQTVTLTDNDCGNYRVAFVLHSADREHFAFEGINQGLYLWCRHAEGKIQFYSDSGSVSKEEGEKTRQIVNANHVLLRYICPLTGRHTEEFPYNPNGSRNGIAGLVNENGCIIGHMAHPEVSVYSSRDPRWFRVKDQLRRQGIKAADLDERVLLGIGYRIFRNIVEHFK